MIARHVNARRWTNRQGGLSVVEDWTAAVLVVAEAMHESAASDMPELIAAIAAEFNLLWYTTPLTALLRQSAPRFTSWK